MKHRQNSSSQESLRERFLNAIDMVEFGIALMRQNLVRRNPAASEDEINSLLDEWLFEESPTIQNINSDYSQK